MFKEKKPGVTFVTSCWENDWERILSSPDYLKVGQIENHGFPFWERVLIINNVKDPEALRLKAEEKVEEGVLSRFFFASDVLEKFGLKRSDFTEWQYYNALGPLNAIDTCITPYLLYQTGDVYLEKRVRWIDKAIKLMEKNPRIKVANLTWNQKYKEARRESYRSSLYFYHSLSGFSDQMFFVRTEDFQGPIYGEIREDGAHFPRGDVWEKRTFSYMKNRGWERITFRGGSYIHKS